MKKSLTIGAIVAVLASVFSTPAAAEAAEAPIPMPSKLIVVPDVEKVTGPIDIYREGTDAAANSAVPARLVSGVPFNFVLSNVSYGIDSRAFKPGATKVCMDMRLWYVSGPGAFIPFGVQIYDETSGTWGGVSIQGHSTA